MVPAAGNNTSAAPAAVVSTAASAAPDWARLVSEVLADPSRLCLVFQPIVSLQQAVIVGYEALARFDGPPGLTPDLWFRAADRQGRGAELEATVVRKCLALRDSVPPDCFLTLNVSPHLLTHPALGDLLLSAGNLSPLVLELTEHEAVADLRPLVVLRDKLAANGALLALDDAGSGYSGLQQITQFRPHIIKLDRALVADADHDEVKLALAELLGEFAGRIDAWLLAEGIETWGEVGAFLRLRIPLGQGYLLGRPAPPWSELDPSVVARLRSGVARAALVEHVASLVDVVSIDGRTPMVAGRIGLRLDAYDHPVALLLPLHRADDVPGGHRVAPVSLRVPASAGVAEVARRVVARPEHCRLDPVVCVDEVGRAVGVVRIERLLLRLAELKVDTAMTDI